MFIENVPPLSLPFSPPPPTILKGIPTNSKLKQHPQTEECVV